MKRFKSQIDSYVNACYPGGCTPALNMEIQEAFMAGAIVGICHLHDMIMDSKDNKEADKNIGELLSDIQGWLESRKDSRNAGKN